jgi:hypothetical protein
VIRSKRQLPLISRRCRDGSLNRPLARVTASPTNFTGEHRAQGGTYFRDPNYGEGLCHSLRAASYPVPRNQDYYRSALNDTDRLRRNRQKQPSLKNRFTRGSLNCLGILSQLTAMN